MRLNPETQYATDRNLRARQRLWESQEPPFDIIGWVLDLAGVTPQTRVLDVGCGNGTYLARLCGRGIDAVGADLSTGMLRAAPAGVPLVNADARSLPVRDAAFDIVLAPHMLYHVPNRAQAAVELGRVLDHAGTCVVVTNGIHHLRTLRDLIEAAATPDRSWAMKNPSIRAFSLENGAAQLQHAFTSVELIRPQFVAPAVVRDPQVVADYAASVADHYEHEIERSWTAVVDDVRAAAREIIETEGALTVSGDVGAFFCTDPIREPAHE